MTEGIECVTSFWRYGWLMSFLDPEHVMMHNYKGSNDVDVDVVY